jgi:predicted glycoside hydrolase/deacetylase ChbG (UPF0249 family)
MGRSGSDGRWIVLHADDFGMNAAINAGILQAFREGLLTSTSLLANAPAAEEACAAWPQLVNDLRAGAVASSARRHQLGDDLLPFDLGVHLNLTQGRPLSDHYPAELLNERGQFSGIGPVFRRLRRVGSRFRDGVRAELQLQIERVLDQGIQPTHLNGHQYVELMPGVAELIPLLAEKYSIRTVRVAREPKLVRTLLVEGRVASFAVALIKRHFANRFRRRTLDAKLAAPARFFGTAHAGLVSRATLRRFLDFSSPFGTTEIGLHPATVPGSDARPDSDEWFDPLVATRPGELEWLCDPSTCGMFASRSLSLGRLSGIGSPSGR